MENLNDRRRFLQGVGALGCSIFAPACAHRTVRRMPRLGFLTGAGFPTLTAAFLDELRRLGYVDGSNFILEMRQSRPNSRDGEAQTAELTAMDLDLLVVAALPQAIAVRQRNPTMPMVIGTGPNLVGNGFANSLERPGRNVTGMDELPPGLTGRRLALLKSAAAHVERVALLSTTPGVGSHDIQVADAIFTASTLGIAVTPYRATSLAELQAAVDAIIRDRMDGLVNFQGALSLVNRDMIIGRLRSHRIAAIYQSRLFAESGGLMALSPDQEEQFREAARYADRILRGAKPGDLPIKHPSRYFLTVNLPAAAEIGLALRPEFLRQADMLIR